MFSSSSGQPHLLRFAAVLAVAASITACSEDDAPLSEKAASGDEIIAIMRDAPVNSTQWVNDTGTLAVREGCLVVGNRLVVLPKGAEIIDSGKAVRVAPDSEPLPLDGTATVLMYGTPMQYRRDGAPKRDVDAENLSKWAECRDRLQPAEDSEYWLTESLELS